MIIKLRQGEKVKEKRAKEKTSVGGHGVEVFSPRLSGQEMGFFNP